MHIGTLTPEPPYNFERLLDILARTPYPSTDIVQDGAYYRVLQGREWLALIRVTAQGTTAAPVLRVEQLAHQGQVEQAALLDKARHLLAADADRRSFFDMARRDPVLWRVVEPLDGLPLLRTETVFEALASAIIEQQIAWRAATRAQQWLAAWGGRSLAFGDRAYHAFSSPIQIAEARPEELAPLKITYRRIGVLQSVARQAATQTLDLEALAGLSPAAAYEFLLNLHGVGPWTAAVTLTRALGNFDYVTENDAALQSAMSWYFNGKEGRMPSHVLGDLLSRYQPYAGLVGAYVLMRWVFDRY